MKNALLLIIIFALSGCASTPKTNNTPETVLNAVSQLGPGMTQDEVCSVLSEHKVWIDGGIPTQDGQVNYWVYLMQDWDIELYFHPNLVRIEIKHGGVVPCTLPFDETVFSRDWDAEVTIEEAGDRPRWKEEITK